MTRPIIYDGGETREMNDTEYAQLLLDTKAAQVSATKQSTEITAQASAQASAYKKLAALGLTADEIAAL